MDFVRYVEFEINLESLRGQRAKRLGIKGGIYSGQKRILFVLDRATKKFHGDLRLWMQYLNVAQRQRAFSRVDDILTKLIRMHPTKPEVCIYAATYAYDEHGDMTEARAYMQRGLRFCKDSKEMWLTYARLELLNISKIVARHKILGLSHEEVKHYDQEPPDDSAADLIALPDLDASYSNTDTVADRVDIEAMKVLSETPVLSGAIPMAVFDAAMDHFSSIELGGQFFDLTSQFLSLSCARRVLRHILDRLMAEDQSNPVALDCFIREPLLGNSASSEAFAQGLGLTFARLQSSIGDNPSGQLVKRTVAWILTCLAEELDEDVKQALVAMLFKALKQYKPSIRGAEDFSGDAMASMLEPAVKLNDSIRQVIPLALKVWPTNERLLELEHAPHAGEIMIN